MIVKTKDPVAFAKRMFKLAYDASQVCGMGFLQARNIVTEEQVWKNVVGSEDYPGRRTDTNDKNLYADYVFGRMMKFGITIYEDSVEIPDKSLVIEYQSWATTYPAVSDLVAATHKSFTAPLL